MNPLKGSFWLAVLLLGSFVQYPHAFGAESASPQRQQEPQQSQLQPKSQLQPMPIATKFNEVKPNACVIILHGMGRTAYSMHKIEQSLLKVGYRVWNAGYPSLSKPIEVLAKQSISAGLAHCRESDVERIHFITHSLGGILLRYYLQENTIAELDKVVMLSPPNHGSEVVDVYRDSWFFRTVTGPAFLQLGTDGLVMQLKPIPGTIGIITGNKSSDPWFSSNIPGPDDGKVSVASAKLDEMVDFRVVPVGHTFIMRDAGVINQLLYFLLNGAFSQDVDEKSTSNSE